MNEISLFKNYYDPIPVRSLPFFDFVSCVMEGDYIDEIGKIRGERDKAKRDELKANLPAVSISGVFSRRGRDFLKVHSGLICLDFDEKENPKVSNWEAFRNSLTDIVNVKFAALSASGRGVFVVIPLAFPGNHLEQFEALRSDFSQLGYVIDKSCSDVSRLRGMSSDKKAYYNRDAEAYRRLMKPKASTKYSNDGDCLPLIQKIISEQVDITGAYKNWFQIGAALAAVYGEKGRGYFHQLSKFYPKYDEMECDIQYDKCLRHHGGYTQATLYYYAKQYGVVAN